MTDPLVARAEQHAYQDLFIQDLHWSAPDHHSIDVEIDDGEVLRATNVSSYKGLRVWVCDSRPGSRLEAQLDRELAKTSTDRLVIFHDEIDQVWRWPARRSKDNATATRLTRHRHRTGSPNPKFAARLKAIMLPTSESLDVNSVLAKVRAAFDVETQNETRHASQLMARMYVALERAYASGQGSGHDHEISLVLARILFLMFGDDTDMWAPDLFRDFIHTGTDADGSDIAARLTSLFVQLDTPAGERELLVDGTEQFPYVNGGIFEERIELPQLDTEFRETALDACAIDWSTISPAIFGSMFQSVRDAGIRHELGEHYTSEENILKTLNPLFLDELRDEFARAQTMKNEARALRRLWQALADIRFIDPACGCGNFIIVAYRELRDLELQIMERLQEIQGDAQLHFDPTLALKVTLDHFSGVEIDEWPARIAETAMFLVDRQCDLKLKERFGEAPQRLPIRTQARIVAGESALRLNWAAVLPATSNTIVAGNPPFLGISLRSRHQTEELKAVWGDRYHGTLDYVSGWYAKALEFFAAQDGRWAFVSTNSITQGEAVAPLWEPILANGWKIKFAHRTFRWTSEAPGQAAVHCVIIGFARNVTKPRLFEYSSPSAPPIEHPGVSNITPYLTDGPTVIVSPSTTPLNPQLGEVVYGNKPTDGGGLVVEPADYPTVAGDPIAARYLRQYVGARELLHGGLRHCLWLTDLTADDLEGSPVLQDRLERVRAFRTASSAASTKAAAATPHLFRQIAQPTTPYLCIPAHVSESRPYFLAARFDSDVITSNANFLAADADGFMFAVISSTMFITWQRTVGGRIKSDLRFNKFLTWNTFPLPTIATASRATIIEAGQAVMAARNLQPDVPLADLYAPGVISDELRTAHQRLDREIGAVFELDAETATELEMQDTLFARYEGLSRLAVTRQAAWPHRPPEL